MTVMGLWSGRGKRETDVVEWSEGCCQERTTHHTGSWSQGERVREGAHLIRLTEVHCSISVFVKLPMDAPNGHKLQLLVHRQGLWRVAKTTRHKVGYYASRMPWHNKRQARSTPRVESINRDSACL